MGVVDLGKWSEQVVALALEVEATGSAKVTKLGPERLLLD